MANRTWTALTDGFWDVATNWDGNTIPQPLDDVTIDVAGDVTVTHRTGDSSVNSILLEDAFVLSGGTLTANTIDVDSSFTLGGGTLIGAIVDVSGGALLFTSSSNNRLDGVTIQGDINLDETSERVRLQNGSTFTGEANLTGSSAVLSIDDTQTLDNVTINLDGSSSELNVNGGHILTLGSTTQVNLNASTAEIRSGLFGFNADDAVINQGTINADATGSTTSTDARYITAYTFTNEGTINATNTAELFLTSTTWTNATNGVINATNSKLIFQDDWDNDGVVNLTNSDLDLEGTFTTADIGTINRTGTTSIVIEGTLDNTGNTLTFDSATGSYILNGGIIQGGSIEQNDGERLKFTSSSNNRLDGVTVQGDINLDETSERVRLQNGSTFTGEANLTGSSAVLSIDDTQTLDNVTINLDGSSSELNVNGGHILTLGSTTQVNLNASTAEIRSGLFGFNADDAVINQGTINADATGSTTSTDARYITAYIFTNEGTINATNTAELFLTSTTWTNAANGVINATNSKLIFQDDWDNDGVVNLTDSDLDLEGTFTTDDIGTINRTGTTSIVIEGTLDNTGNTLTFDSATGSYILNGGIIQGGSIEQNDGERLKFTSSSNNRLDGVTVQGDINLDETSERVRLQNGSTFTGEANLTGSSAVLSIDDTQTLDNVTINLDGSSSELNVNGGHVLTLGSTTQVNLNASTAEIRSGLFGFNADDAVINQGTINADATGSTTSTDARYITAYTFTNEGTINATNTAELFLTATTWSNAANGVINATDSKLIFQDDWDNDGVVNLTDSELDLEGTFTTDDIGTINRTGTTSVVIEGTLDNTDDTLTFDSATGSYILNGGIIQGGTIEQNDGEELKFTSSSNNQLDGVTVQGDINLDETSERVRFQNGATFTGNANLTGGNTILGIEDTQTLDNLTINLDGVGANLVAVGTNTLTLGSNAQVNLTGDESRIRSDFFVSGDGTVVNQGTITADGTGSSFSTDERHISPDSFTNEGSVQSINDADFFVNNLTNVVGTSLIGGTYKVGANSILRLEDADIVNNAAIIELDGINSDLFGNISGTTVDALANFANNTADGSFTIRNGRNLTTPGNFTNAGAMTIGDSSTFTVTGNYTQTGGSTTFEGGTLTATGGSTEFQEGDFTGFGTINADVTNSGEYIADADADILDINGDYIQSADGVLNIELGGTNTGDFDQFNITGTATLGGTLNIMVLDGAMLQAGDEFTVLTFANALGSFDTINTTTVNGLAVRTEFNADNLRVFVNTPPVASEDTPTTDEESSIEVNVLGNDSDIDGDAPVITAVDTTDVDGTVTFTNFAITYDPNGQFEFLAVGETATETFEYTIDDNFGGTDTATVTVTIDGVNDNPIATDDTATTDEDNAIVINPLANDSDVDTNDVLTIQSVDTTGISGIVTFTDTAITYNPNGQFEDLATGETATETFSYTVSDGNGGTNTAIATITITGVDDIPTNENPVADDDTASTDEASAVLIDVLDGDTDLNDDALQVTAVDTTGVTGLVTFTPDTVIYDPNGEFEALAVGETATETFSYTISDGNEGTDTATVTVTIDGINDAPVVENVILDQTATEDEAFSFTVPSDTFSDLDTNDNLTYAATLDDDSPLPSWLSFDSNTQTFSGTPPTDAVGTLSIKLTATDTANVAVSDEFVLTVDEQSSSSNVIEGTEERDRLTGTEEDDSISAFGGSDIIDGRAGNDNLNGGAGNDRIIGGPGADTIDGGEGNDLADYRTSPDGVTVNLATGTGTGGDAEGDTITNIERIHGSNFDDQLTGDAQRNTLIGYDGADTLNGEAGNDNLQGREGADTLNGGEGNDRLQGDEGADTLNGGTGLDWATYRLSEIGINVNLAAGTASGGDAEGDTLTSIERVQGSQFNDEIVGDATRNVLIGLNGDDSLSGGAERDSLNGQQGADRLTGGSDRDTFTVRFGDSLLGSHDHITDLEIGSDRLNGPNRVAAADVAQLGIVASLAETDLQSVLTTGTFVANGAATFSIGTQTFVALNDSTAGFEANSDIVIEITGFSGNLNTLAIV